MNFIKILSKFVIILLIFNIININNGIVSSTSCQLIFESCKKMCGSNSNCFTTCLLNLDYAHCTINKDFHEQQLNQLNSNPNLKTSCSLIIQFCREECGTDAGCTAQCLLNLDFQNCTFNLSSQ
ncbi:hypothetical protein ACTFIZ_005959 [Dictyostelium cf. discoideum]